MEKIQFHLNAPACSGRGVRIKLLSPDETNQLMLDAAKILGSEGTMVELKKLEWSMGVRQMICSVTVQKGLKDVMGEDVSWKDYDRQLMDQEYKKLFGPKDDAILQALYRQYHEVSQAEVDAIAGKALPVLEG